MSLKPLFGGKNSAIRKKEAEIISSVIPNGMKGGIFYIRVSTDKQEEKGNGLESQKEIILNFAKQNNVYQINDFYLEVGSGGASLEHRPILRQAIEDAKKYDAYLITSKLDRLSRRSAMICNMLEENFKFITVEYGFQADSLIIRILAAWAQKEKELIGERTRLGLAQVKKRYEEQYIKDVEQFGKENVTKKRLGIPSVQKCETHISHARKREGYLRSKKYVDEMIQPTINELIAQDIKPNRKNIAERMRQKDFKTEYGNEWTPSIIYHTLNKVKKMETSKEKSEEVLKEELKEISKEELKEISIETLKSNV